MESIKPIMAWRRAYCRQWANLGERLRLRLNLRSKCAFFFGHGHTNEAPSSR